MTTEAIEAQLRERADRELACGNKVVGVAVPAHELIAILDALASERAARVEAVGYLQTADDWETFYCGCPDTVENGNGEEDEEPCGKCESCLARAFLARRKESENR
jgi:hypothetical protein